MIVCLQQCEVSEGQGFGETQVAQLRDKTGFAPLDIADDMTSTPELPETILAAVHEMLIDDVPRQREVVQLQVAAALVQDIAYDHQQAPSRDMMIRLLMIVIDLERAMRELAR
jgi:hypothetical protein